MKPKDDCRSSINPRRMVEQDDFQQGIDDLAQTLADTGYLIQKHLVIDLWQALESRKPLLIEGPRGGGKTMLPEALAEACNLTVFYLQGMEGLTLADVLYDWDRVGQNQMVQQELVAGTKLKDAQDKQYTREYLILGEALGAFEYAGSHHDVPVLIIDEADKFQEKVEYMLLQLLGRGYAHVPCFGNIGVKDPSRWPVVFLLSNNLRRDLSVELRSRCIYTWLNPPTPIEELRILRARAPMASQELLTGVAKLINCIRRDLPTVRDKPGVRESIDLISALARAGVKRLTGDMISRYLCFLGKNHNDWLNLHQGLARLEFAVHQPDAEIDQWVAQAFQGKAGVLEEAA